ncbi:MAG: hypothetical protein K9K32_07040 [Halanaerobiales bacterium]|nr:hypothetical protein [Halanaerobiales bacterium]
MIDDVKEKIRDFKDPIIKLERAIDGQLEFYYSNQKYFIFYLREICNYREDLKKQIVELKKEYLTIIEDIIKEGCKRRVFKDVDLEITASGLFGLISVFASNQVLFSSEFSLDNIKINIKKVLLNGLLRG